MTTPRERIQRPESQFVAALWCFVLAAVAGVGMRFYLAGSLDLGGLDFSNLRRAHSHLMLFGWVTPALAILIVSFGEPSRLARASIWWMLGLGLLSFPSFLVWGYGSAEIAGARVPLSIIVSTASMFAWYAFAIAWIRVRRGVDSATNRLAVLAWDGAIALLTLGSAGAWARGALMGMGVEDPFLQASSVEFFLTCYTGGFLLIGVLGLVVSRDSLRADGGTLTALAVMVAMTPFEFLAALPVSLVPETLRPIGAIAVFGTSAASIYFAIRASGFMDRGFLVVLGGGKLLLIHPEVATEALALGLRIPYLHILLLGFVTLGLIEAARKRWPTLIGGSHLRAAVIISLIALLPTTGLWPDVIPRQMGLVLSGIASTLPVLAVVLGLSRGGLDFSTTRTGIGPIESNTEC